jgi:predicted ATPase
MELQLKNIGMIKEANVKIDGLTVIAGENDTGKSTVGKALFLAYSSMSQNTNTTQSSNLINLGRLNLFGSQIKKKIFSIKAFNSKSKVSIANNGKSFVYDDKFPQENLSTKDIDIASIVFIETPVIWNLQDMFRSSSDIESHLKLVGESIDVPYPYLMKDLYFKLATKREYSEEWTKGFRNKITSIIDGKFIKDEDGIFRFYKDEISYDLVDIATGIKTFGILQVLLDNNRLNSYSLLILDEPEVHLHPKWQLEMAKVIVELVKNGVKVLVNSHSPYMIEALQRYAELEKVTADFYLAEDGYIKKENDSNSKTLAKIFEKLSEPFDVFEEMESERFQNG